MQLRTNSKQFRKHEIQKTRQIHNILKTRVRKVLEIQQNQKSQHIKQNTTFTKQGNLENLENSESQAPQKKSIIYAKNCQKLQASSVIQKNYSSSIWLEEWCIEKPGILANSMSPENLGTVEKFTAKYFCLIWKTLCKLQKSLTIHQNRVFQQ